MSETITDISKSKVEDSYLTKALRGELGLHRYSKDQVIFVGKLIIPVQVRCYNEYVSLRLNKKEHQLLEDPWVPMLNGELKSVTKEEVMKPGLEAIAELYEKYEKIAPGSFYSFLNKPFRDEITYEEVDHNGSPMQWLAMKRFEGFVTKYLWNFPYAGIRYSPLGTTRIHCLPDREIAVPWNLDSSRSWLNLDPIATFWTKSQELNDTQLEHVITANYNAWKKLHPQVASGSIWADVKGMQAWSPPITLSEVNYCRNKKYLSWQDLHTDEVSQINLALEFGILKNQSTCEAIGLIPQTDKVAGPAELYDFVRRFLRFEEKGTPVPKTC